MEFSLDSLNIAPDVDVSDFFETSERQSSSSNESEEIALDSSKLDRVRTCTSSSNENDRCPAEALQWDTQGRSSTPPAEKLQSMNRLMKTGANTRDEDDSKMKPTESRDIRQHSSAQTQLPGPKYTDQPAHSRLTHGSRDTGRVGFATPNLNHQKEKYQKCHKQTTRTSVVSNPQTCTDGEHYSVDRVATPLSLSPWERWVVQKAHQERERREKIRMTKVCNSKTRGLGV